MVWTKCGRGLEMLFLKLLEIHSMNRNDGDSFQWCVYFYDFLWGLGFRLQRLGDFGTWGAVDGRFMGGIAAAKVGMMEKWNPENAEEILQLVGGLEHGYGSIPINTIFSGMNIHLPAILGFTRGTGFWLIATCFIFHNIWDNPSHLTFIFFKMVKTTNQTG